jgi:NitT/TauT family transport system substrate-binding protein
MKRVLILTSVIFAVFSFCFGFLSCQRDSSEPIESIVISYAPFETLALLWTADEQGYFTRNGINATFRKYDTGAGALDAVLKGEADIAAGTAEFPLVGRAFKKEKIRTIGSIDKIEHINVVARKDRGIEQIRDLKGKKVGTTLGTVAEFYLGRLLELNGMTMQDITVVDLKTPLEWVNAVVDGEIDAVVTAQPHANAAIDALGAKAVVWSAQSNQPMYALVVATDGWIKAHPALVNKFLKSLAQAEEYVIRNPAEAKTILQKRLNLDAAYMETVWSQNQYGLSLDQSLILAMEDEARWMIGNGLTSEKEVPDFLNYIYTSGLEAVKPEAVRIIRAISPS